VHLGGFYVQASSPIVPEITEVWTKMTWSLHKMAVADVIGIRSVFVSSFTLITEYVVRQLTHENFPCKCQVKVRKECGGPPDREPPHKV
jgi:hypothetical protein